MPTASSPAAVTMPDRQADSALAGMISPAVVSVSSSIGSISTNSSSGSMRPANGSERSNLRSVSSSCMPSE